MEISLYSHIEELSGEEIRAEISELSKAWRDLAKERFYLETNVMYKRAMDVNSIVRNRCKKSGHFNRHFSTVICYGVDLKIRGFAILKLDTLPLPPCKRRAVLKNIVRLMYLSKDPSNLFGEHGYKGVGVKIVNYVIQRYESFVNGVYVEPLPAARSFFASFGFVPASKEETGSEKGMIWRPASI